MKRIFTLITNVVESIDIALINIKIGVGRKFPGFVPSSTPFLDGSIELNQYISSTVTLITEW
jgi:hypothetical protein